MFAWASFHVPVKSLILTKHFLLKWSSVKSYPQRRRNTQKYNIDMHYFMKIKNISYSHIPILTSLVWSGLQTIIQWEEGALCQPINWFCSVNCKCIKCLFFKLSLNCSPAQGLGSYLNGLLTRKITNPGFVRGLDSDFKNFFKKNL